MRLAVTTNEAANAARSEEAGIDMTDMITVRGFVATEVRFFTTNAGLPMASFRLASTDRKLDRETHKWVDAETNWYNVTAFRHLAQNLACSVNKGDPVVVSGRLRLRQWNTEDGKSGTSPDIDADVVGHDLGWGTARFQRPIQLRKEAPDSRDDDGRSGEGADGIADGSQEENRAGRGDGTDRDPFAPDAAAPDAPESEADGHFPRTADGEFVDTETGELMQAG
jgi:single-strand DNA-binding protein